MKKEGGQMILILILIMTVALAIGLSIVQKSLVDVSTSSKVEQSSRAFSAAEAGIERALNSRGEQSLALSNNSSIAKVVDSKLSPPVPDIGITQDPLEYPPLAKEDVAQVWLAGYSLTTPSSPPDCGSNIPCQYIQNSLDVYWGNSSQDKAALEITLIWFDGTKYTSDKWFYDSWEPRSRTNKFTYVGCVGGHKPKVNTYYCKQIQSFSIDQAKGAILIRARLLYNSTSQPFAVQARGVCGFNCSIPPQSRTITSTGVSGETQRKVEVFQLYNVVPHYFDYAIFSAGEISK